MRTISMTRGRDIGKGSFVVGIVFLILFMTATITAVLTLTALQVTGGAAYDAAMIQLLTGFGGLGVGAFLSFTGVVVIRRYETYEDLWSWDRGWVIWGIIGFTGARLVNTLFQISYIPITLNLSWQETLNIVLSAAVFEEALFSLAFSTLLFIALKQALSYKLVPQFGADMANWIIIVLASFVVSLIFMQLHVGAGLSPAHLSYTFIARFVYNLVYLRSRNIMAPVGAHMLNNYLLFVFGI